MTAAQSQSPAEEQYVHRINELRDEIRQAMAAISGNQLPALEESLWRQEVLCTGLKYLLGTAMASTPGLAQSSHLQASLAALFQVNQAYAALLQQAQASNHLLAALCRTYNASSHGGRERGDTCRSFEA